MWLVLLFQVGNSSIFAEDITEAKGNKMSVGLIKDCDGKFTLMVKGTPFEVKGVAGVDGLDKAAAAGANSFRTWGVEDVQRTVDGKPLLDYALEHGLYVTVGLWVEHERHGFSYQNKVQVQRQRDRIRAGVRACKNHPAVLMWGLGNEMEGLDYTASNAYIWKELNVLAGIVKEEDPNHPVMTVIALPLEQKIKDIQTYYPALDILGINAYGGAVTIPETLRTEKWSRPVVLTEFGPFGQWEVAKTSWGAPVEPTSTEKAAYYLKAYDTVRKGTQGLFLGSYAFFWGSKHEATPTWYGMFLASGEKLASVDIMTEVWTGSAPANRCPVVSSLEWSGARNPIAAGAVQQAKVTACDPENDVLKFEWIVMAENAEYKAGGDQENTPPVIPGLILKEEPGQVTFKAPSVPGAYRLYVYVRDGKGSAATANVPFLVEARR
jgi:hypothetical protein